MWIVELSLKRPYTFIVVAILMLLFGGWFIVKTQKDIFPVVDIPVINVIWSYSGLPAQEFEERITTYSEYALTRDVSDIERIESQTIDGIGVIRLYFYPGVKIEAAEAQVVASSQLVLRRMPAGIQPPIIIKFTANAVPIIQLILSSEEMNESELYDYGWYRIRQALAVVKGITIPLPFGGQPRQMIVDVDPIRLQSKGLSPRDVNNAINAQNVILPTGDVKIGNIDYRVNSNNTPLLASDYNDIPVKVIDDVIVYVRDIGHAHDGFIPQINVVRREGIRGVLVTILKNGDASTLEIVNELKALLPEMRAAAPKGLNIDFLFDQSKFVKGAIFGVVTEGVISAILTAMMIFIFLGSWRSTFVVFVSIPLAILTSITILSFMGQTLNLMTLGGLALSIGILVDHAIVTVESFHRNEALGKPVIKAILDSAKQISVPIFVSTLTICIVFLPVALLVGPSKFLFVSFALAFVFAIFASFFLSRSLVPVMIKFLLKKERYLHTPEDTATNRFQEFFRNYHERFDRSFNRFLAFYNRQLFWALGNRLTVCIIFGMILLGSLVIIPFVGRDFFPQVDAGQFRLHVKAPTGTRIEVTEQIFGAVENELRNIIPPEEIDIMIDNIGVNSYEPLNFSFGDSSTRGVYDGEILIALKEDRSHSSQYYINLIREKLYSKFPDLVFYFQAGDMINQILNFGLPTPIDIKVIGYDKVNNFKIANEIAERIQRVPGTVDVNIHQVEDAPQLFLNVDRTLLALNKIQQIDVANDVLISYGASYAVTPNFWLDTKAGIPYAIAVQTPQYAVNTIEEFMNMPISTPKTKESQLLSNLAKVEPRIAPGVTSHFNIQPCYDIYANVQDRDLGGVASDIGAIIQEYNTKMPPGNKIIMQGVVNNMDTAFGRLGIGFIFALILVYLIMVINFQSWLDPFIVLMALPGGVCGVLWMLYLTHTTFNVPSLMGIIMTLGVASANSILLVSFANLQMFLGKDNFAAIKTAADVRLRPILMTAFAMIVGMIPMALGFGEAGEQNAPLGRAVIGGLIFATITTLFFVPVIFSYLRTKTNPYLESEEHGPV